MAISVTDWCDAYARDRDSVADLWDVAFPCDSTEAVRLLRLFRDDPLPPDVSFVAPTFLGLLEENRYSHLRYRKWDLERELVEVLTRFVADFGDWSGAEGARVVLRRFTADGR